jgi:two-component system, cell cycle sensor histidine kinase and response regulator CckA
MNFEKFRRARDAAGPDIGATQRSRDGTHALESHSPWIPHTDLATFIELLPDIALLVRPSDGRLLGANGAALAAYGYSRSELLSLSIHRLRAPDMSAQTEATMAKANADGIRFETVHRHKNGSLFEVEVSSRGLFHGKRRVLLSTIRDVSIKYRAETALRVEILERRRALVALAYSENRYRVLFNALPEGVMELNLNGRVERANHAQARMCGCMTPDAMTGHEAAAWVAPSERSAFLAMLAAARNSVQDISNEFHLVRPDGSGFIGDVVVQAIRNAEAIATCFICTTRDVSACHRALDDLRESEQQSRAAVEQAVVGVARVSLEGMWLMVNEKLCTMLQYSEIELLARDEPTVTHSDDIEADNLAYQRVLSGSLQEHVREKRYLRKDGTTLWALSSSTVIRGKDNAPRYFNSIIVDITERKQAEFNLALFKTAIDRAPLAAYWLDSGGRCVYVNDSACRSLGYSHDELQRMTIIDIARGSPSLWRTIFESIKNRGSITMLSKHHRKDGGIVDVEVTSFYLRYGDVDYCISFAADIGDRLRSQRERDQLQQQFNQAQKMESVGRLAGGIAHDFNNVLTVITLNTYNLLEHIGSTSPCREELDEIANAAMRAAALTRQLLTFARKQAIAPKVLNLNETIEGMLKMLSRLLGENLELEWLPASDIWPVKMDPSQLDQLLANLCVNSRDAISDVGKVVVCTFNRRVELAECEANASFAEGDFAVLTVSDNGCGMDASMLPSIFEPFFTTKPEGKGTGLGLATVYGIVKQNGGFIDVSTDVGKGTCFSIYLPKCSERPHVIPLVTPSCRPRSAGETIMIVEDEPAILKLVTQILRTNGYAVLPMQSPDEAIRAATEHRGTIQLLVTDVILPIMNGHELSKRVCELRPEMRYLFMSGYSADIIANHGVLEPSVSYIQKPFSADELVVKIREVLDV